MYTTMAHIVRIHIIKTFYLWSDGDVVPGWPLLRVLLLLLLLLGDELLLPLAGHAASPSLLLSLKLGHDSSLRLNKR